MSVPTPSIMDTRRLQIFPVLAPLAIEGLRRFGVARSCGAGDSLVRVGEAGHTTRHPIIEGYDPPEGWGWCHVDEIVFGLSDRATPHIDPNPRYF